MATPPASSQPKYPIPWIASYLIVGFILIGASIGFVWYMSQFSSEFDYDDPDMRFLERIVVSADPLSADFSKLNGGDWQALCLVGWNVQPDAALAAAGIDNMVAATIIGAYKRRFEDIKKSEFMLIYVIRSGAVKALRHPHGFAFAREGAARCTTSKDPVLDIPAGLK